MSFLEESELITEDYFPKDSNITAKLKWKLCTKLIREPSKEAWTSLGRESN